MLFDFYSRSVLLEDLKPKSINNPKIWTIIKIILASIFGVIAYGSLIPALFSSLIWKFANVASDLLDFED